MKFARLQYDSIYKLKPNEMYGMGKESLRHDGRLVELDAFLRQDLLNLCANSKLGQVIIRNIDFDIIEITDDFLEYLKDNGKARQICYDRCGYHGCTKPTEHELYWIITHDANYNSWFKNDKIYSETLRDARQNRLHQSTVS
jgi:hypothetical protein